MRVLGWTFQQSPAENRHADFRGLNERRINRHPDSHWGLQDVGDEPTSIKTKSPRRLGLSMPGHRTALRRVCRRRPDRSHARD